MRKDRENTMNRWPVVRLDAAVFFAGKGERLLDVGCGNGGLLLKLKDNFYELYGIEIDDSRIDDAKKNLLGLNARILKINLEEKSSFPDDFFDTIILCDVIEHIYDVFASFSEITRILKPGGRVITITPNIAYFKRRLMLARGIFPSTSAGDEGFCSNDLTDRLDGAHIHYFTYSMLTKLYRKYGLKIIKKAGYGRLGFIHNIYPSLLSPSCLVVGSK